MFKDIEKRQEYFRERKRSERSGAVKTKANSENKTDRITDGDYGDTGDNGEYIEIHTNADLLLIAEMAINEVLSNKSLDVAVMGRTISSLINSALRAVEGSETEQRIKALEDKLGAGVVREISEV
jgi:hypothetical protein